MRDKFVLKLNNSLSVTFKCNEMLKEDYSAEKTKPNTTKNNTKNVEKPRLTKSHKNIAQKETKN